MVTINTRLGQVRGIDRPGSMSFLGLPYAAPPVDERRWLPPAPASPWSGVFDATQHPNRSFQLPFPQSLRRGDIPGAMSEDMLYLNVHTPAAAGKRRPVQVYIHGGGFTVGSANDFDPTPFARKHDVVMVAINYRLGSFGFLDLSRFGPDYVGSGSLGFQDQIAALRWIAENIADYGGDPDNVTISGVSAGAGSVIALMGAPRARGLFHKAIAFSPGEIAPSAPDFITPFAAAFGMSEGGFFDYLRDLSSEDLFKLQSEGSMAAVTAVDGTVIAAPCHEAIRNRVNPVPLIIGACIDEGTMLTPAVEEAGLDGLEQILAGIAVTIGAGDGERYMRFLDTLIPGGSLRERMTRLWFDYFRSPTVRAADACTAIGVPAWVYSFEVPTEHEYGPTHASDMPFSFNLFDDEEVAEGAMLGFHPNNDVNRKLMDLWTDCFARFMRTGDPNGGDLPHWPTYTRDTRPSMVLREQAFVVENLDSEAALLAYGLDDARG
ncbi:MAG: carboxylesterase family protein [Sphingomonas sp.]|nr:carboxylesterase family protein [Sphingomonas sp.]